MPRIVAGVAGGRHLRAPPGRSTRPTSDRVRESLFMTLQSMLGSLHGLVVLDLYSGSGALGLEALSRGAAAAVLVETDRQAARVAAANAAALELPGARVLVVRAETFAARRPAEADRPADLVLADPPYSLPAPALREVLDRLHDNGWLAADVVLVVERASRDVWEWPGWVEPLRTRQYGQTRLWYGRARTQTELPGSAISGRSP